MAVLASKGTASVTLAIGETLNVLAGGQGVAVLKGGALKGQSVELGASVRKIGPFPFAMPIMINSQNGAITYYVGADSGAPHVDIEGEYDAETGQTVLDDASRAAVIGSGFFGRPSFYFFGSSSTLRSYDSTQGFGNRSYIARFLRRCKGGAIFAGASGVSGEDSVAQVARLPGVIAALPSPRPTHVVLQVAGNDIVNSNNLNTVTLPNIVSMVGMVLAAGMVPVLMSNNTLIGLTADQIIRAAVVSEYMRALYRSDSRIRLADVARWTGDTTAATYTPIAGATSVGDNLHPTAIGAYLMGDALYEAVQHDVYGFSRFAALPNLVYDATQNPSGNLIANPFLLGTGGSGGAWVTAGSVPTGMQVNRTAGTGTVAISTVARNDGLAGNWKRFTFTMQAGDIYSMFINPVTSALTASRLYGVSEAQIDTTLSNGNVKRASLRVRDAANTLTMWDGHSNTSMVASDIVEPSRARAEFLQTPVGTWPNYGNGSLSHDLEFTGTGTFVLDIAAVGLYQV